MKSRLRPHRKGLCINHASKKALFKHGDSNNVRRASIVCPKSPTLVKDVVLLLFSNEKKATMKDFVIKYKYVLN